MLNRGLHHLAALIALGLAIGAAAFLIWFPCMGRSQTSTLRTGKEASPVTSSRCVSLLEANGPGVLRVLAFPVVLGALGAGLTVLRMRAATAVTGAISLIFCALAIFSVGIFFLPSAVALLVAAAIGPSRHRAA
jgi:hypothetical protein